MASAQQREQQQEQQQQPQQQQQERQLVNWIPSTLVDKTKDYLISFEDFPLEITPYTRFEQNGLGVRISGLRLFFLLQSMQNENRSTYGNSSDAQQLLLNKRTTTTTTKTAAANFGVANRRKQSCKNVCFKNVATDKRNTIKLIHAKLKVPPCIDRLLKLVEVSPRGDRFQKRFVLNSYIINVITCTKCNRSCLRDALNTLYDHDDKCVREVSSLLNRDEANFYKPPNCSNMKRAGQCFKSQNCKGCNPLCNK
nr:LEF-2 [Calliteara abietis nucleopolyhedrovirus]